jgi:hypothetical protein
LTSSTHLPKLDSLPKLRWSDSQWLIEKTKKNLNYLDLSLSQITHSWPLLHPLMIIRNYSRHLSLLAHNFANPNFSPPNPSAEIRKA